ncbi:ADL231Wp [Eremothecium gossypii ATCC 10895]|uniref:ADL231Wp n=1 Tax=Eremothecium gossypii (strain ATCC 10895 / CBS 109.51 / FGSC 9923 / NRRL Y-1056) TaxID=284811 RepID=Q75B08_EREGS|nr:ADL231Wp [Eremothecium gossypii ATCC 10895]AAS51689.2 ADL231Wp [Eremothecium gossypii ATCC 10895]AEY95986.1 FADL231Wp [Eremothecium gossypii FDAG1]
MHDALSRDTAAEESQEISRKSSVSSQKEAVPAISSLLGPQVANWPYSETSLIHALELKVEQEKTKQQYYKLENVNRSIDLVKTALEAQVPGHFIPLLFKYMVNEDAKHDVLGEIGNWGPAGPTRNAAGAMPVAEARTKAPVGYRFPPETHILAPEEGTPVRAVARSPTVKNERRKTRSPARSSTADDRDRALSKLAQDNEGERKLRSAFLAPAPLHGSRGHRRNISLPSLQLYHRQTPLQQATGSPEKKPLRTVLNFGSWQSYNPHLQKTISSQQGVRKHRRARSASTFGVIDLNQAPQSRPTDADTRSRRSTRPQSPRSTPESGKPPASNTYDLECENFNLPSEPGTHETPMRKPNFANDLLNS